MVQYLFGSVALWWVMTDVEVVGHMRIPSVGVDLVVGRTHVHDHVRARDDVDVEAEDDLARTRIHERPEPEQEQRRPQAEQPEVTVPNLQSEP